MRSQSAQLFHDHVLVKEPGTAKPTPWHQDSPYYFVDGQQTLSFWIPVEPVEDATLRCVKGSHKWPKPVLPTRWLKEDNFYADSENYIPVPDPDKEGMPSQNGPCNLVILLRSIFVYCMAREETIQKGAGEPYLSALWAMMLFTAPVQAQLLHLFLVTIWFQDKSYAKIGFPLSGQMNNHFFFLL